MKTKKYLVPAVAAFVLVAGLLVQATISYAQDQGRICIKDVFPAGKITDRWSFLVGALFVRQEIDEVRQEIDEVSYRKILNMPRDRKHLLTGLEGVQVLVEDVNPKAEKYGLTQHLLQTEVELRLRQHGIRILTDGEFEEVLQNYKHRCVEQSQKNLEAYKTKFSSLTQSIVENDSDEHFIQCLREVILYSEQQKKSPPPQPPYLYINISTTVSEERNRAAFSIQVALKEHATLPRNGAFCTALIWETRGVAGCSLSDLKEYVREHLRDTVDEFINAYLAANPKDH